MKLQKYIIVLLCIFLQWPRQLNALQLQKTHANRKSTSKSRKHHQFNSRCCKCSQHNQINNCICSAFICLVVLWVFAVHFFIWLQLVCCQNDEVVFLICRCCFLFAAHWALSATIFFCPLVIKQTLYSSVRTIPWTLGEPTFIFL